MRVWRTWNAAHWLLLVNIPLSTMMLCTSVRRCIDDTMHWSRQAEFLNQQYLVCYTERMISANHSCSCRMNTWLNFTSLCMQVQSCGSLVTEEQPHSMFVPMELFLMGYSFYQRPFYSLSSTPTSPLSPPCVAPELLSPESLGLKLKPIKTRVSVPEE